MNITLSTSRTHDPMLILHMPAPRQDPILASTQYTTIDKPITHNSRPGTTVSTSGIRANWNPRHIGIRRGRRLKEKTSLTKTSKRIMVSTSNATYEIRKFDGKNFTLWKEMIKDV